MREAQPSGYMITLASGVEKNQKQDKKKTKGAKIITPRLKEVIEK